MRSSSKIALAGAAALLVLAIGGSVALATAAGATAGSATFGTVSTTSRSSETSASLTPANPAPAAISPADAARIAIAHVGGGRPIGIEREVEHGRLEWKVDVLTSSGERVRVRVDAANGSITRIEPDGRDDRGRDDRGRDDRGRDDHGGDDHGGDDRGGDDRGGNRGRH